MFLFHPTFNLTKIRTRVQSLMTQLWEAESVYVLVLIFLNWIYTFVNIYLVRESDLNSDDPAHQNTQHATACSQSLSSPLTRIIKMIQFFEFLSSRKIEKEVQERRIPLGNGIGVIKGSNTEMLSSNFLLEMIWMYFMEIFNYKSSTSCCLYLAFKKQNFVFFLRSEMA